jgi:Zn finger protein HypA/HybF involved in hydrogenase expression
MKNECGKCHQEFEVTDNEFFCDTCKPTKQQTIFDLDKNSDECLSCQ